MRAAGSKTPVEPDDERSPGTHFDPEKLSCRRIPGVGQDVLPAEYVCDGGEERNRRVVCPDPDVPLLPETQVDAQIGRQRRRAQLLPVVMRAAAELGPLVEEVEGLPLEAVGDGRRTAPHGGRGAETDGGR